MKKLTLITFLVVFACLIAACNPTVSVNPAPATQPVSTPGIASNTVTPDVLDETYTKRDGIGVIYFAGGCFWGVEKLMQSIPGVVNATSGYANGQSIIKPTYSIVISGTTGYRETVRVEYKTDQLSLDALVFAYFRVIDPTVENAQGFDVGTQYQTGIYYLDEAAKDTVERIVTIVKERYQKFVVEIEPLERFFDAEDYHQNYLDKVPGGYCHVPKAEISSISNMIVDPGKYPRPANELIKSMLNDRQFNVTQLAGTEPPFDNEYWDSYERGIYVDIVTGEPLFSSSDKFVSETGWPSFTKGIDENTFVLVPDNSLGMVRTEVRSRAGNSHLGHLFENDPNSPNGIRYCINSAALRFVPYEKMEAEGYGYLLEFVD